MALNPYIVEAEPKPKRESVKLKPKWKPKHKERLKPPRPVVGDCKIRFLVWGYSAKVDEVTTVTGRVKGLTAASAAFAAGQEASKLNEGADVQRLEVWLEDAETQVPSS